MIKTDLSDVYRHYIACLYNQHWPKLEQFVHDEVCYNSQRIGLLGYREMLERDFYEIPDLNLNIQLLLSDPPYIASRLAFACTPKGKFLGLHVNGKRIAFTENVFYEFRREKIERVWSIIDKAAIEAQLYCAKLRYLVSKRDCLPYIVTDGHSNHIRCSRRTDEVCSGPCARSADLTFSHTLDPSGHSSSRM